MSLVIDEISKEDKKFLKTLGKKDIESFFDLVTTAATYQVITKGIAGITEGTHQFIRDIEIAQLLQEKFHNMAAYTSADGFKGWLEERMSGSNQMKANALNRLQGDGAGEIDFLRAMKGSFRKIIFKPDLIRDAGGRVASNTPGIDLHEINRFTGKVVNTHQVKTLRSLDSINKTLKDFVNNNAYDENTVLVGPKELIKAAKKQGLKNPTRVMGSVQKNAKSADALQKKILAGNMAAELTAKAAIEKVAGGALIGAGVSISIASLINFIAYKKGEISKEKLFEEIGKEGAKGAITGGALAGVSLFVPGGMIGVGIGFAVSIPLKKVLDDSFGDGMFAEVLELTHSVQANIKMLHDGSVYVADLVEASGELMAKSILITDDLRDERFETEDRLRELEDKYHENTFVNIEESLENKFANLDIRRKRMENNNG